MIRRQPRHAVYCSEFIEQQWKCYFQLRKLGQILILVLIILFARVPFAHAQQMAALPSLGGGAPAVAPAPPSIPKPPVAANPNPTAKPDEKADKKIINNPFAPGGVVSSDQLVTRQEVVALLAEQEDRLRKELSGSTMSADELSKLVSNAATPAAISKPDNFMGCVNGIPLYREIDGTLDLGTKDPEPIRQERCGNK